MRRLTSISSVCLAALIAAGAACGPRLMTEPEPGFECEADDGCNPELSECVDRVSDRPQTCRDVCDELGEVCVARGCGGATAMQFSICDDDVHELGVEEDIDCDEAIDYSFSFSTHVQCCCAEVG